MRKHYPDFLFGNEDVAFDHNINCRWATMHKTAQICDQTIKTDFQETKLAIIHQTKSFTEKNLSILECEKSESFPTLFWYLQRKQCLFDQIQPVKTNKKKSDGKETKISFPEIQQQTLKNDRSANKVHSNQMIKNNTPLRIFFLTLKAAFLEL